MATIKSFQDIEAWQLVHTQYQKFVHIAETTALHQNFRLKDQAKGSSGSVMDNIAEGYGRGGNKEFINFLGYARGSNSEFLSQLIRMLDRNYISPESFKEMKDENIVINNKITAFINYLKSTNYKRTKFPSSTS